MSGTALSADERAVVEAIAERLIPTDALGPGAGAAGAAVYIDRALQGPHAAHADAYAAGLRALSRRTHAAAFTELPPDEQDAVLSELERSDDPAERAFFELVRQHVIEAMFGDPTYGGNAGGVGWHLLGYPGPRPVWTAEEQRIELLIGEGHASS